MRKTLIAALLVCGAVDRRGARGRDYHWPEQLAVAVHAPVSGRGSMTKSILTVGDSVGGYRLVGIPDGLGVAKDKAGNFTVDMNHELATALGSVRAHGSTGAFVSQWSIRQAQPGRRTRATT